MTRVILWQSRPPSAYDYKGGDAGETFYRGRFNKEALVVISAHRDEVIARLVSHLEVIIRDNPNLKLSKRRAAEVRSSINTQHRLQGRRAR